MLPKNQRIPRKLFGLLKKADFLGSNQMFLVRGVKYIGPGDRYCFSVSKKTAKNANIRNKMRRIGYGLIKDLNIKTKKPTLFQITCKIVYNDAGVAKGALVDVFKRINLIQND